MINNNIKKIKRGSNGMVPKCNSLIPNVKYSYFKYLNVPISCNHSCAGMAEWSTHFVDTEDPFGFVGSIPTLSATNFYFSGGLN